MPDAPPMLKRLQLTQNSRIMANRRDGLSLKFTPFGTSLYLDGGKGDIAIS
jgi:hypothetical protein